MIIEQTVYHAHLCGGIGGFAKGMNKGKAQVGNYVARFECLGSIDNDAAACRDFESQVGVKATCLDLFSREQYRDFHGHEPPAGWCEATTDDFRRAYQNKRPNVFCISAPCKGFSGLLSEKMSGTKKYQALNGLTLRAVFTALETYKDDPVELYVFENVPRIASRGRFLLDQIVALFRAYGYAVAETTHDCGEIGNLGQSRKRFLLVARFIAKVPTFLYEPVKHPLRGVGEILDRLPIPGIVPGLGGPMHRMPSLQWKTWVRLAFVRAGADWRSLNDLRVENGALLDFGILPDAPLHSGALGVRHWEQNGVAVPGESYPTNGSFAVADPRVIEERGDYLGVNRWEDHSGAISSRGFPTNGAYSVADPREFREQDFHGLRVNRWLQHAGPITTQRSPGSSAQSVADPRLEGKRYNSAFRIVPWGEHSPAVMGPGGAGGGVAVADPRSGGEFAGSGKYRVTAYGEAAGTVIGASTTGQGAFALADPRYPNWHPGASSSKLRVTEWTGPARPVTGSQQVASGAGAVADPRVDGHAKSVQLGVGDWNQPAAVIKGDVSVGTGRYAVADPRPEFLKDGDREHYQTAGNYGVVAWPDYAGAVAAHGGYDNGRWSVADPRDAMSVFPASNEVAKTDIALPAASDKLICTIRALDGTWHRPFTTLELAALQGLVDPEEELILDGMSDSAWRERIGNMVPPPAAAAIAGVCGVTLLSAWSGQTFMMGSTPIWVRNVAVALMASTGDPS
jgi:site-specific DNA-cytosine methylase